MGLIAFSFLSLTASAQLLQDTSRSNASVVRDPARQASTEIDAVINNPAGTAFLKDGWHISLNGLLTTGTADLSYGGSTEGNSFRDVIPSIQAAYKKNRLTISASFANEGGYGLWNTSNNPMLSYVMNTSANYGFNSYKEGMSQLVPSCNINDKLIYNVRNSGDSYNFTGRLGAAYKLNEHWSVYAGLRLNYVSDFNTWSVNQGVEKNNLDFMSPDAYFSNINQDFNQLMSAYTELGAIVSYLALIMGEDPSDLVDATLKVAEMAQEVNETNENLAKTPSGYSVEYSRMNGWGIAPILGIDYKTGKFNFAANYEFETKIHANSGFSSFHIPGKLSLGASWQIIDNLKVALGGSWSHVSDVSKLYGASQSVKIDSNLILNTSTEEQGSSSYYTSGYIDQFDISASMSFSPIKHLQLSAGYTFARQNLLYSNFYPKSCMYPVGYGADIISGGLCYELSDNVKIDLGISKRIQPNNDSLSSTIYMDNYQRLTFSTGVSFNF